VSDDAAEADIPKVVFADPDRRDANVNASDRIVVGEADSDRHITAL
jgi:hypothetical protein